MVWIRRDITGNTGSTRLSKRGGLLLDANCRDPKHCPAPGKELKQSGRLGNRRQPWRRRSSDNGRVLRLGQPSGEVRKQHGLRFLTTEGHRMRRACESLSATQSIERFFQAFTYAGKNRRVTQGIAAAFGFTQRHDEIQEVFRLIALKRDDPFLVVETE